MNLISALQNDNIIPYLILYILYIWRQRGREPEERENKIENNFKNGIFLFYCFLKEHFPGQISNFDESGTIFKMEFSLFLSLFGQISKYDESVMIKKMDLISALQNENKNVIVICFITFHIYI
jgi:hypothetical protein